MKRLVAFLILTSLVISLPTYAENTANIYEIPLPVTVNANGGIIPSDVEPKVINGRTLLPLRAAAEALNAKVSWNETTKQATIMKDNTTLVFTVNKKSFTKNGKAIALDVPLSMQNYRIYLPVRAFAEALNVKTHWDNKRNIVSLGEKQIYKSIPNPLPTEAAFLIDKYTPKSSSDPLVGAWVSQDAEAGYITAIFIHPLTSNTYKVFKLDVYNLNMPKYKIMDLWYSTAKLNKMTNKLTLKEDDMKYSRGPGHAYGLPKISYYDVTGDTITMIGYIDAITNTLEEIELPPFEKL